MTEKSYQLIIGSIMKSIIRQGIIAALISSLAILTSCEKSERNDPPGDPVNIATEAYQKEVIDSANRFAFDLFKPGLADAKGNENIMISPFSITSALSMTLNGAAGETFAAMLKSLGLQEKTLEQINSTYLKLMTEMISVDKRVMWKWPILYGWKSDWSKAAIYNRSADMV